MPKTNFKSLRAPCALHQPFFVCTQHVKGLAWHRIKEEVVSVGCWVLLDQSSEKSDTCAGLMAGFMRSWDVYLLAGYLVASAAYFLFRILAALVCLRSSPAKLSPPDKLKSDKLKYEKPKPSKPMPDFPESDLGLCMHASPPKLVVISKVGRRYHLSKACQHIRGHAELRELGICKDCLALLQEEQLYS